MVGSDIDVDGRQVRSHGRSGRRLVHDGRAPPGPPPHRPDPEPERPSRTTVPVRTGRRRHSEQERGDRQDEKSRAHRANPPVQFLKQTPCPRRRYPERNPRTHVSPDGDEGRRGVTRAGRRNLPHVPILAAQVEAGWKATRRASSRCSASAFRTPSRVRARSVPKASITSSYGRTAICPA